MKPIIAHPIGTLTVMGSLLLLAACNDGILLESGIHADGSTAYEYTFRTLGDGTRLLHGTHSTWHPSGTRHTLEHYLHGRRAASPARRSTLPARDSADPWQRRANPSTESSPPNTPNSPIRSPPTHCTVRGNTV